MAMNPADLFKIKSAADQFNSNHPKLVPFFRAVGPKVKTPGTVIEMAVIDANGERIETNMRVQESDLELLKILMDMGSQQ